MQKFNRLPWITLFGIVFIILAGLLVFRPYWGLMDDATHTFSLVPLIERMGIFSAMLQFAKDDLGWGMFRPIYPLMVYPLYKPGMLFGAPVTFFLNAIFALFCVACCTITMARVLGIRREWALVGVGAFFYEYDLFQHPSLQEKIVLLAGAALLRLSWGPRIGSKLFHFFLFVMAFLMGVGSKASFMIFFSVAFWAFFSACKEPLIRKRDAGAFIQLGAFACAGLAALFFFAYISSRAGYTQQYSVHKILPNLLSPEGAFFLLPLFLFVVWVLREPENFLSHPERCAAFLGVLAFLVIFLPWGIKAYVQSVIGPVYCCLWVQLAEGFLKRIPARLWQIPLATLAIATAAYRVPVMFIRLHDIGLAVDAIPEWERRGIKEIFLPCMEGTESMRGFAKNYAHSDLKITWLNTFHALEGKSIFFDLALCPLPGRVEQIPGCASQEVLFQGGMKKSFKLARGTGCS